ncbi:hypothetical protein BVRB_036400 [Beta vulgaris subsp. vulgaris]|uniref:Uncharacterized protein n=1 Tax=Beta vulgaris subsp. vulgaris TaxID=3555 RepID=A0A0J7YPC9_BETVV|nr:hypothetical protein BVRB_036400 [Beta vulgaris subsp. vulgaris]
MINLKWNIVHSSSSANISFPIPELKLAILSRGHTIALITNDSGQYSRTSIQSTTLMIPTVRNSFQAKEIRSITQRILKQKLDGLTLQIAGISDDSSPVCMLQNVFNLEQAIAVKKTGKDAEPNFTMKTAVAKFRSLYRSAENPLSIFWVRQLSIPAKLN